MLNAYFNVTVAINDLFLVYGHYGVMRSTDSSPGYSARLQTPYIDTTDLCLELYFQSQSTSAVSKSVISVVAINEEEEETVCASTEGLERTVWDRLFAKLPNGVHRVVVEGSRSQYGYSSMFVDDIVVQPCENFGNVCPQLYYELLHKMVDDGVLRNFILVVRSRTTHERLIIRLCMANTSEAC